MTSFEFSVVLINQVLTDPYQSVKGETENDLLKKVN